MAVSLTLKVSNSNSVTNCK